jgi:glycosyltransferase involved in cell wall biosynthesis
VEVTSTRTPVLSAIVISQNNASTILRTIRSIVAQECPDPIEIILVDSGSDGTVEIVKAVFPSITVVKLQQAVLPGRARNEGLKLARGDYVSFPGSHVELLPGSLAVRIAAHKRGYAMVTGAISNGTDTPSGWASYFIDHAPSLPERPSGPLKLPPNSCSYERRILIESGLFPEDRRAGEDTVVNQLLWDAGYRAYRDSGIRLVHITRCRTPWLLMRHHFMRGRAWGRILTERGQSLGTRDHYVSLRLDLIDDCIRQWGESVADLYRKVQPLIRLGVTSAWLGAYFGARDQLPRAGTSAAGKFDNANSSFRKPPAKASK